MTTATIGNTVNVHYTGTFQDGTEFDSSHARGEPITFEVGSGTMIAGFDAAVNGMKVGETKNINLTPESGYGDHHPDGVQTLEKNQFPDDFEFEPGVVIEGVVGDQTVRGIIQNVETQSVVVDFNHPMAGKNLNFEIELVEVK